MHDVRWQAFGIAWSPAPPARTRCGNETEEPVHILMLSTRKAPEILEYPDSDKVVTVDAKGEELFQGRHGEPAGYWDGET